MSLPNLIRNGLRTFLCVLALAPLAVHAQSKEYQVKAAFLFNFAQFVEWPDSAYADSNTLFSIGILGEDPFGSALDQTVGGETIGNHRLIVRRSQEIADLKDCQMIFVGKSEKSHVKEILAALGSRPVLTVGETEGFSRAGGDINFYLEGSKVRFEIDPGAVRDTGLKISSQLLSLGKIIEPAKEGK